MRKILAATLVGGLAITGLSQPASAYFGAFDFTATGDGGPIGDDTVSLFSVSLPPSVNFIQSIELEIAGLSHGSPMDLDVYLVNPRANLIEIMTDRGGTTPISGVDLTFMDDAVNLPGIPITSGAYRPEGLVDGRDLGFGAYVTKSGGPGLWLLLIFDDAAGDGGNFESFTLRGTVPEPMTLSLLAIGAVASLRLRRKR